MPYQLLIRNHTSETLAELFNRGKCLTFDVAPFSVDEKAGVPSEVRLSFREVSGEMVVRNDGAQEVSRGDELIPQGEERPLHHGNILLAGDKEIRFYRLHGRPGVSKAANIIGFLALAGIVLSLAIEFGSIVRLPFLLKNSSAVRKEVGIQELTTKVDKLRKRLNGKEIAGIVQKDSVAAAYLEALKEEMEKRVRFYRANVDTLTEEERQEHLANLDRLETILDRLAENPSVTPQIPEVKIDIPVNHLIEKN